MQSQRSGWKGVDYINLSQKRDKWRDLVNARNKPSVSVICRN
jgi:hypothetical protein